MDARAHIAAVFRKFATYSGRSPRAEYWIFAAFSVGLTVVGFLLMPLIALIALIVCAAPGNAVAVRRLHDVGWSGWWLIAPVLVIPAWLMVWAISAASALAVRVDPMDDPIYFMTATWIAMAVIGILAFLLMQPSQPGENSYGPNPNEVPS